MAGYEQKEKAEILTQRNYIDVNERKLERLKDFLFEFSVKVPPINIFPIILQKFIPSLQS